MGIRDVVLILTYVVGLPLSFVEPYVGVLFWTWVGYFNPQEFTWGIASHIPIALLVALATLSGLVITPRKQIPPLKLETVLLLLLWAWFCVTTLNVYFAPELNHHWIDSITSWWQVSKILLMIFVAMALVLNSRQVRLWYLVTAGSFAFFALKGTVFGFVTSGEDKVYGPKNSMIYDNNDFGLAMNIALPMFVAFARTEKSKLVRWGFWLSVPMGMVAVILTYSRGAMLGMAFVGFAMVMRSKRRLLALMIMALLTLGIFAFAPAQWFERMHTLGNVEQDKSAQARFHSWAFATKLFMDHPITGGGFQTFTAPLYEHYNMLVDKVQGPHSIYFQVLAEHGFPGILLFIALIASCLYSCGKLRRNFSRRAGKEHLAAYAEMVQLGLLTFLISGTFLGRAYFDLFYQLVATVVVLKVVAQEPDDDLEPKNDGENYPAVQLEQEATVS
jgi:probable O-glycosylation ligase (exosortase A-associated)